MTFCSKCRRTTRFDDKYHNYYVYFCSDICFELYISDFGIKSCYECGNTLDIYCKSVYKNMNFCNDYCHNKYENKKRL